jgi:hypothetical protein
MASTKAQAHEGALTIGALYLLRTFGYVPGGTLRFEWRAKRARIQRPFVDELARRGMIAGIATSDSPVSKNEFRITIAGLAYLEAHRADASKLTMHDDPTWGAG